MRSFYWTLLFSIAIVIGLPICQSAESHAQSTTHLPDQQPTQTEPTAETQDLHSWVAAIAALHYETDDFRARVNDGKLAELYVNLQGQQQTLRALRTYVKDPSAIIAAADNVQQHLSAIQSFYRNYIHQSWFGDAQASRAPDAIVILGASQTVLEERLTHALPIIQQFKATPVVLSGGGRTKVVEAQIMRDYLKHHSVPPDRLIMETDSVDTVGNAIFSAFALARKGIHSGKVLVVTSDFHAPRSLYLFRTILGPKFTVAVAAAPYHGPLLSHFINDELQDITLADNTLLHWPALPEGTRTGIARTCDVFFQSLLRHKRYASRWDLARRYADQCDDTASPTTNTPSTTVKSHP